jgi:hypothetical protein
MLDLQKELTTLTTEHPKMVRLYPPVSVEKLERIEEILNYKMHDLLHLVYSLSNGFSVGGYNLYGIDNIKLATLLEANLPFVKDANGKELFLFMYASGGGHDFGIDIQQGKVFHSEDSISYPYKEIAPDIETFFSTFLQKAEVMLKIVDTSYRFTLLDDERLPENLQEW